MPPTLGLGTGKCPDGAVLGHPPGDCEAAFGRRVSWGLGIALDKKSRDEGGSSGKRKKWLRIATAITQLGAIREQQRGRHWSDGVGKGEASWMQEPAQWGGVLADRQHRMWLTLESRPPKGQSGQQHPLPGF